MATGPITTNELPTIPPTLYAVGRKHNGSAGNYQIAFPPRPAASGNVALKNIPERSAAVKTDDFSSTETPDTPTDSQPKKPDEPEPLIFKIRYSRLLNSKNIRIKNPSKPPVTKVLKEVKVPDGGDDTFFMFTSALPPGVQPIFESVLGGAGSVVIGLAAENAVEDAKESYKKTYPDRVRQLLDDQMLAIQALTFSSRQVTGEAGQDLAVLRQLYRDGFNRYARRDLHRQAGLIPHLRINRLMKKSGIPGNGELSKRFNAELQQVIDNRLARDPRLVTQEISVVQEVLRQQEWSRHQEKTVRTNKATAGAGMTGMYVGVNTATGQSIADAVHHATKTTASATAGTVLGIITNSVMTLSQIVQVATGITGAAIDQRELDKLEEARNTLESMRDQLSPDVLRLYMENSDTERAMTQMSQALNALLAGGQGTMAVGTFTTALGLAGLAPTIVGAAATITASVGKVVLDHHQKNFHGDHAHEDLKKILAFDPVKTALKLHATPLNTLIDETGQEYLNQQQHMVDTQMHKDILGTIKKESILIDQKTRTADQLHAALQDKNRSVRAGRHLLDSGKTELAFQRIEKYPPSFFERTTREIHESMATEFAKHPLFASVLKIRSFREAAFHGALQELANLEETRGLFADPATHKLAKTVVVDAALEKRLWDHPLAKNILLKHYNRQLAKYLEPANRYGRDKNSQALYILTRAQQKHDKQVIMTRL